MPTNQKAVGERSDWWPSGAFAKGRISADRQWRIFCQRVSSTVWSHDHWDCGMGRTSDDCQWQISRQRRGHSKGSNLHGYGVVTIENAGRDAVCRNSIYWDSSWGVQKNLIIRSGLWLHRGARWASAQWAVRWKRKRAERVNRKGELSPLQGLRATIEVAGGFEPVRA